jgi:hypothetical protein
MATGERPNVSKNVKAVIFWESVLCFYVCVLVLDHYVDLPSLLQLLLPSDTLSLWPIFAFVLPVILLVQSIAALREMTGRGILFGLSGLVVAGAVPYCTSLLARVGMIP